MTTLGTWWSWDSKPFLNVVFFVTEEWKERTIKRQISITSALKNLPFLPSSLHILFLVRQRGSWDRAYPNNDLIFEWWKKYYISLFRYIEHSRDRLQWHLNACVTVQICEASPLAATNQLQSSSATNVPEMHPRTNRRMHIETQTETERERERKRSLCHECCIRRCLYHLRLWMQERDVRKSSEKRLCLPAKFSQNAP